MKSYIVAALAIVLSSGGAPAENISACTLIVDGRQYINGPCDFSQLGKGDFQIMLSKS
jgi:hypothetical protein